MVPLSVLLRNKFSWPMERILKSLTMVTLNKLSYYAVLFDVIYFPVNDLK